MESPSRDRREPLEGVRLVLFLTCAWGGTLIGNTLCTYPAVFAYTIQQHLDISSYVVGLFLSLPALLAFMMYLVGPAIVDTFGVERVFPVASLIILAAMCVVAAGYNARSAWLMLPAFCLLRPLLGLMATSKRSLLGCSVGKETYASLNGLGTAVVTAGFSLAHYTLPRLSLDAVLPTLVVLTVFMAAMNQYAAWVGAGRLPSSRRWDTARLDGVAAVRAELVRKLNPTSLRSFPWKYWLIAFCGAFKASFYAFVDFQPYAFQRCNGLSENLSNQIVGSVSICTIALSPLAGMLFARYKDWHGPLFVIAASMLLAARMAAALEFSVALAWCEMITTGMGQAFLSAGSMGLVPEVLAGREDLLVSGNSFVSFFGELFCTVTTQVCFVVFQDSRQINYFNVTPGQFFMVAQGLVLLVLTIAIYRVTPLAPCDHEAMQTCRATVAMQWERPPKPGDVDELDTVALLKSDGTKGAAPMAIALPDPPSAPRSYPSLVLPAWPHTSWARSPTPKGTGGVHSERRQ